MIKKENHDFSGIKIAKKNEYRGVTNARLEQISLKEVSRKSYLTGKIYIAETIEEKIGGYSTGIKSIVTKEYYESVQEDIHVFDTKTPVVTLKSKAGKVYKAEVTKGKDGLYEFKIAVDTIGKGEEYTIFAETQDSNNKSPYRLVEVDMNTYKINNSNLKGIELKPTNKKTEHVSTWGEYDIYTVLVTVAKGDITGDGKINTKDAREALLAYIGKKTLTAEQKQAADVNGDGKVNTKDARQILLYYIGKIKEF